MGGGGVASELFAEGKEIESVNRSRGIGHAGDEARRTQMVFVDELGGGVLVLSEEPAREGDVIGGEIAGSVGLVNNLAGHVVDILGNDGTDGLLYSATFGVVGVTGGSGRAVPECAIHLNGAILRVIEIDVVAVVSHVAGGVILIGAVDGIDEPIGSGHRSVESVATAGGDGFKGWDGMDLQYYNIINRVNIERCKLMLMFCLRVKIYE